MKSVIM